MSENPTIWIANEAGHSYQKALDLVQGAELKPLTIGRVNPLRLDRLAFDLVRGITRYVKPTDYLLISGTPMVNALAMHLWLLHHRKIKILQWNAKRREYELVQKEEDDFKSLIQRELERG